MKANTQDVNSYVDMVALLLGGLQSCLRFGLADA